MRRSIKIIAVMILAVSAYSILPVVSLYLHDTVPLPTNDQIAEKLGLSKQGANNTICKARRKHPEMFPYRRGDKISAKTV